MTTTVDNTYDRYTISAIGPYAFSFRIFNDTDLAVTAISGSTVVPLTLDTHYTVPLASIDDADGGSITLVSGVETTYAGYTLDIRSNTPVNQVTSIRNSSRFLPEVVEDALDYLNRQNQDADRRASLSPRLPDNEIAPDWATLLSLANRKGKYGWFYNATTGAPELVSGFSTTAITQGNVGAALYPQTAAELAAGVTPVNFFKYYGDPERYATNATPGTTDMTTALANAALVSDADGGNIVVSSLIRVTSNTTLPAGATLCIKQGGGITVDSGDTLTLDCKLIAARSQIFFGSGTVLYGSYLTDREAIAFPEWFGAVHDNSTNDRDAIQAAISMVAPAFGAVSLSTGYYRVTSTITVGARLRMFGVSRISSVIVFAPTANDDSLFDNSSTDNCVFERFGMTAAGSATGKRGFTISSTASAFEWRYLDFSAFNDWAIDIDQGQYHYIENCRFGDTHNATNSGVAILTTTFMNRLSVNKNRFYNNDRDLKVNTLGSSISFCENSVERTGSLSGVPDISVELNNVLGFKIDNNYCEAIRTDSTKGVFEIVACQGGVIADNYMVGDLAGTAYTYRFVNCTGNTRYVKVNNNVFVEANVASPILARFISAGNFAIEAHGNSYTRDGVALTTYQDVVTYIGTPANVDLDIPYTFTYDPGNLADGAGETSGNQTVTGATFGDAIAVAAPYSLQGITATAYVSAANTCVVRLQNESGGAVDLASGTWRLFRKAGNL